MSQTKVTDALRNVTAVDGTKINAVDGAKITTGTIPEARITSLDATKLTGNIANARIPASAVTQHVTGYNDASIRADILKLALHQAIDGNRVAYNLEDSFIDGFEDDTGITTETAVDRDTAGEYVSSVAISESSGTPAYATGDRRSIITLTYAGFTFAGGTPNGMLDGVSASYGISAWANAMTPSAGAYIRYQFTDNNSTGSTKKLITEVKWYQNRSESHGSWRWQGSNDASSWTNIGNAFTLGGTTTQTQTELSGNTTPYTYYQMLWQSGALSAQPYMQEIQFKQADVTASTTTAATGALISDPQTASTSRTSASGVIIYEDQAGTNTLGTDLKIYFSCDNSAWTEAASYGTATTYSGTKKLVKLGATTCTAGTSIAMKAVWANQVQDISAKTITSTATANHSTTQAKFGATSIYTDAAGKLSIADHSDFDAISGTSDFTIEFWIHSGVANRVCGQWDSSNATSLWTAWMGGAGSQMYWNFYYGSSYVQIGGGANLANNSWHHVAGVRNGTTFASYIDGSLANSTTNSGSLNVCTEPIIFGEGKHSGGGGHIGYFDDIRISNTARYTSAFSVPSAAFASDANTLLLIRSDTTNGSTVFSDATGVTGKEARLHGWAVNY